MEKEAANFQILEERLLSLDFFRGITMFLLIAEFTHLFEFMVESDNPDNKTHLHQFIH